MEESRLTSKTSAGDFYNHKIEELQQVSSELSKSFNAVLNEGDEENELEIIKANLKDEPNLEILVDLARQGDIDPWDLDLERVTTAYLRAISNTRGETLREAGQAIFYASVLLRMKSDILVAESKDALSIGLHRELDDDAMLEDELANPTRQITFNDLEAAIRRRFIQKAKRFRKLTLKDLISALQDAREEEDARIARKQQKLFDINAYQIVAPELSGDIMDLTHAEDLEHCIARLQMILPEHLLDGEGMEFRELIKLVGNWSNAFLAVIFLAHENKIKLVQKEFYGDMWIYEPESK